MIGNQEARVTYREYLLLAAGPGGATPYMEESVR